jgi:hypothetical protein
LGWAGRRESDPRRIRRDMVFMLMKEKCCVGSSSARVRPTSTVTKVWGITPTNVAQAKGVSGTLARGAAALINQLGRIGVIRRNSK